MDSIIPEEIDSQDDELKCKLQFYFLSIIEVLKFIAPEIKSRLDLMNDKGKININEEFNTSALNLFKHVFQNPEKIEEYWTPLSVHGIFVKNFYFDYISINNLYFK
jgi:hypothetical protein